MLIIYVSSQTIPLQIPLIFLTNTHTLARGKVVRLSGTQTRPHVDYETSSGINPGKGQQRPFFSPRCLLLSPVRQAPPNPTLCRSPVEMLNLWKSCVLPHFLLYLRYVSDASQVQTLQASLHRSLSTTLYVYGHPPRYFLRQVFPPFTLPRTCNLLNSDLDCTPLPLPLFNIFSGNSGSLSCQLCPCTPSKATRRLQYVTWT